MHAVLEYWCRDHDAELRWTRDPAREGPLVEDWLDPVDPVPAVLAAIAGSATTVRVALRAIGAASFSSAALLLPPPASERVLLACPDNVIHLVRHYLRGRVPEAEVGSPADLRRVTLLPFACFPETLEAFDRAVIVAGPPPREAATADWRAVARPDQVCVKLVSRTRRR